MGKPRQAIALRRQLRGVPYKMGHWPLRVEGTDRVEGVKLTNGRRQWTLPCDLVACGFGLVPNTELATLLGCKIQAGSVNVDSSQQTSVPGVFSAGEATGIGGLEQMLVEGQIAGYAATGQGSAAERLFARRERARRFARRLEAAFALRPELRALPTADTLVSLRGRALQSIGDITHRCAAKLHTRCGMGRARGRVCGPAVEYLFGWEPASVRPPIFPVPLGHLGSDR